MRIKEKNTLYFATSMYNRAFILNYVLKQLKKNNTFKMLSAPTKAKIVYRFKDGVKENKSFICSCASWSGLYISFIINSNYYYFQLDDNSFFNGLFYKIKLDENNNYIGARYAYTEEDLFKSESLQYAIKINYFEGFDVWREYSNKTLLKYAKIYYKEYFEKYFLNIRDSERVSEKKRVNNFFNSGYHFEVVYDNKKYNIFNKH